MFQMLKRRLNDVQTLTRLCTLAEELAIQNGRPKPGSEHFIVAALALPDQTAAHAFELLGINETQFLEALAAQRSDALASVKVIAPAAGSATLASVPHPPKSVLYEAEPSGQFIVQRLAETREARAERSLLGADVLLAAAQENYTSSSRAFQRLGVSGSQLTESANQAITSRNS